MVKRCEAFEEVIGIETRLDRSENLTGFGKNPSVQLSVGFRCDQCIKIIDVGKQETEGVTDLSVLLSCLLQDTVTDLQVGLIIRECYPESEDLGAVLLDHLVRCDDIPFGLTHLLTLVIDGKAVGDERLVRRLLIDCSA